MPLQLRRGTDAQRSAVTPAAGEPLWITDTNKLYIGDGTSTGGIEVSGAGGGAPTNASYIVLGTNASLSAERALVIGTGLSSTDAGANGNLTIALAAHAATFISSGTLALARGGLAADISTTGGAGHVLKQTSAGGAVSVSALVATDLPTHNHVASNITSGTLALSIGGLAADISTTGGSRHFLKQTGAGSVVSVSALAATELGTSGTPGTDTYLRGDLTWQTVVGGSGAPTNASYIVLGTNASLDSERVLAISTGLASTDGGANGNLTIALATHAASFIGSGTVALARGGLAADISTTGGVGHVLRQTSAGAAVSVSPLAASDVGAAESLHQHAASDIVSGTLALARGGANASLAATGPGFLRQTSAGANVSVAAIASTDLPTHTHAASDINSGTLALARGGLAADISATGGTRQFLKQTSAGSAVSVGVIAATELGTSGTADTTTFLRGDLTWAAPSGGTGGGTKTYARFTPLDNQPQTSAYATFDTRDSGVAVLDFDSTSLEAATFVGVLPEAAVTTNGLKVRLAWTADTVTNTDAVVWGIQFQKIDTTTDLDADAFSNTVTATAAASGTAGVPVITEITLTGTANLDSIVAGDFFRIRISRDGTNASDALTADACLVACEIRDAS